MHILVAGAAGFIGSHLCERLLSEGHSVIAVDNLYSGQFSNIERLRDYSDFHFIDHDVINPLSIEVEGIFNLACPASPVSYQKNPSYTLKTSILGAISLLDLAKKNKVSILLTSTSEVYGDPQVSPQNENYWGNVNPIGIRSCYDEGKRAAETIFTDYRRQFNLDTRIVRIFNTYGPRMRSDDGRVVSNFIVQALSGNDITIYGAGKQIRSLCFVDDLVDGLVKSFFTKTDGKPINLGNPEPVTVLDLANDIIELTNSKSKIAFYPALEDDPQTREPDITRAQEILSWAPKVNRIDGLKLTIPSFMSDHLR
jgi:UDP-glucuronate decarboxylase